MVLIDRDPDAVKILNERFKGDGRVTVVNDNFSNIKNILRNLSIDKVDGIIADLGVSSYQLDTPERGFSFHADAPLDMRMGKTGQSAFDVVNTYSEEQLKNIIYRYGEEQFAPKIAANIVKARSKKPIETTLELADIIACAMPAAARREAQHPAKRTFQAIRIEVNGELKGLEGAIQDAHDMLAPNGVMAVITFHSLEDRIVKQTFRRFEKPCTCDPKAPICTCGKAPTAAILTKKPITAGEAELKYNPRARSAKLRAIERL